MGGPAPAVARVRAAVRTLLLQLLDDGSLRPGEMVLVACSGGPDSTALASQTAFLAPRLGVRAGAVVVDHGLAPDSRAGADRAASLCAELGLQPVDVRRAAADARTETAARASRYDALTTAAHEHGASGVLLGHTLDDQAETVLLALGRGSGTRSVAGMPSIRDRWWRPLLDVRRADTHATCGALGLAVESDPSNAADGPWRRADGGPVPRAAVRDRVLPALAEALGGDPAPALARTAALARADADLLEGLAALAAARCHTPQGLDVDALAAEAPALATRVLRAAAVSAGSPPGSLSAHHVQELYGLVTRWRGQGPLDLPGAVVARRDCGRLVLARSCDAASPAQTPPTRR